MKSNIFALVFGEFETYICVNPSVKTVSQEPVLPAPLTQGSLRRSRARGFIDTLRKLYHNFLSVSKKGFFDALTGGAGAAMVCNTWDHNILIWQRGLR